MRSVRPESSDLSRGCCDPFLCVRQLAGSKMDAQLIKSLSQNRGSHVGQGFTCSRFGLVILVLESALRQGSRIVVAIDVIDSIAVIFVLGGLARRIVVRFVIVIHLEFNVGAVRQHQPIAVVLTRIDRFD